MDQRWKVVLAFIAVFVAGAVFGGVFTLRAAGKHFADRNPGSSAPAQPQVAAPRPKAPPQAGIAPALMRQFTQRLTLTNEQRIKIRPLVGRAAEDLARLRRENLADTTRVMERMYRDVNEWLTHEQRKELGAMRRKMQEKVAEERKKRGDPPLKDSGKRKSKSSGAIGRDPGGAARDGPTRAAVPRPPGS